MRVLHVLHQSRPHINGYTVRSHSLMLAQRQVGVDSIACTSPYQAQGKSGGPEILDQVPYYRVPHRNTIDASARGLQKYRYFFEKLSVAYSFVPQLERLVRELAPDIIHAHTPIVNGLAASAVARKLGIPLCYEVRGMTDQTAVAMGRLSTTNPVFRVGHWVESRVMRGAQRVFTIAESLRMEIVSRGVPPERVVLVPNGVDIERFSPMQPVANDKAKASLGLGGCFVLGYVGSIYKLEGLEYLVRALPLILAKFPNARVLIVGGGEGVPALVQLVSELGLDPFVNIIGQVQPDEVLQFYAAIDAVVLPRIDAEVSRLVTPLKPMEAMALSKPVLGSRVGGISQVVQDGVTGLLFNPEDPDDLAERCCALIGDKVLRNQLAAAGREWVVQNRSWTSIATIYRSTYQDMLGGRQP